MTNLPHYKADDIAACKSIHSIRPDGVVRVRLEPGSFGKKPIPHWESGTLDHPAHAHWPAMPQSFIDDWFGKPNAIMIGMGIACYKFGMLGVDVDDGDPYELMQLIKDRCGAFPLGTARTRRGHRIYYSVQENDLTNDIVGFKVDDWDGKGEILMFGQFDYLWHPVDTHKAIMKKRNGTNKGTDIDISIFKSTRPEPTPHDPNRIVSSTDDIDALMIAETFGLVPNPNKNNTWRGACPFCNEGETRFEVSQGHSRPMIRCWACDAWGNRDNMAFIYERVKNEHPQYQREHPQYQKMQSSIDRLIPNSD